MVYLNFKFNLESTIYICQIWQSRRDVGFKEIDMVLALTEFTFQTKSTNKIITNS